MTRIPSILTALVALAYAGHTAGALSAPDPLAVTNHAAQHGQTRKSLSFGPAVHAQSHRKFVANDYTGAMTHFGPLSKTDIHQAALKLAKQLVTATQSQAVDFYVREDSYVDPASGMHHVFVKQLVNGIVVEDGNLNAVYSSEGELLSYGTSLYNGKVPLAFSNPAQPQETFSNAICESIRASITALQHPSSTLTKRDQIVFSADGAVEESLNEGASSLLLEFQRQLYLYCDDPSDSPYLQGRDFGTRMLGAIKKESASAAASGNDSIMDARLAVLEFIKIATADVQLSLRLSESRTSVEKAATMISSTFEQTARPNGGVEQVEKLHQVPGTTDAVSARLGYIQLDDGELNLVWRFDVPMDHQDNSNFYQVTVDATTGEVRSSADWVASAPAHMHVRDSKDDVESPEALYKVIRWGLNDPTEGNRTLETGVIDRTASPYGWHSVPKKSNYKDTRGNNVIASAFGAGMEDWENPQRPRPKGKSENDSLVFEFKFPWRAADKQHEELSPDTYADASTVNLFYTLNKYHDLLYLYGFTPASGNFEEAEAEEGGRGGDAIVAYSISSAGINNADFTTPPDGSKPRVRMYKWHTKENRTERDGDFEEGIIVHEMTHGVSTRLTGGPADSSCLGWGESGGMGEGWGDYLATIIRRKSPTRDIYTMGSWASHAKAGIRRYPYSTNLTINPESYKSLDAPGYWGVHAIGEVWAGMLYQVEEGLRAKLGWAPDLFPPTANATQEEKDKFWLTPEEVAQLTKGKPRANKRPIPRHGNTLAVQLILDGMKLHPCRPTFFDARDAIVQADKHLTGGANECLIWSRFAQRGLGVDANVVGRTPWGGGVRTNGHKVPAKCKEE